MGNHFKKQCSGREEKALREYDKIESISVVNKKPLPQLYQTTVESANSIVERSEIKEFYGNGYVPSVHKPQKKIKGEQGEHYSLEQFNLSVRGIKAFFIIYDWKVSPPCFAKASLTHSTGKAFSLFFQYTHVAVDLHCVVIGNPRHMK